MCLLSVFSNIGGEDVVCAVQGLLGGLRVKAGAKRRSKHLEEVAVWNGGCGP